VYFNTFAKALPPSSGWTSRLSLHVITIIMGDIVTVGLDALKINQEDPVSMPPLQTINYDYACSKHVLSYLAYR
jgi:hypothetical protein